MAVLASSLLVANGGELDPGWFPSGVAPTALLTTWITATPYSTDASTTAWVLMQAYRYLDAHYAITEPASQSDGRKSSAFSDAQLAIFQRRIRELGRTLGVLEGTLRRTTTTRLVERF